ncbi:MAG: radical SAM family heme chaperone HemW [Halanaerobiales bacterium]|nr:radical SAM family heme chaperone HemW [Halanaerobiales bacterium]
MNKFLNYEDEFGLYIHIPFCRKKCSYCDFYSINYKNDNLKEYLKYLIKEIQLYSKVLDNKEVKTIYIGGGTPSLLSPNEIDYLLKQIDKYFDIENNIEITMESNPDSLNEKKVIEYKQAGINRISVGIQSFINEELNILGRVHDSKKAINIIEILQKHISNYNIDLIFALPGQKFDDFKFNVNKVLEYNPPHISLYNLQIEEGTLLYKQYQSGNIIPVSEELDYKMYNNAIEVLENAGYNHYEISNFAKENYKSKHNLVYWNYRPYLGLGPSAHGFNGKNRYYNSNSLKDYIEQLKKDKLPIDSIINLTEDELISERMIMGLRLLDGINKNDFENRFNRSIKSIYKNVIFNLKRQNLLAEDKEKIYLTKKGLNLGNKVFLEFLL